MLAAETAAAIRQRAAWGCPSGAPAQGHLRTIARAFAATFDLPPSEGCPFREVFHGDGWVQELQTARVLRQDDGLSWPEALERPFTALDRDALVVLHHAEATCREMAERKRAERERRQQRQAPDEDDE